jgi:dolichyl-phosphooligosaccharide-protein glycotransferase
VREINLIERLKRIPLPGLITVLAVAAICGIGLYLRTGPPHDAIFTALGVKYSSIDAYYHMRQVDFLAVNFPQLPAVDPYLAFPVTHGLVGQHFFSWIIGLCVWIAGAGSPTAATVDLVGVYFPAVAGALVAIPVYFIGREIFNRWAGLTAALLAVIIPSEFLGRSALGFTDYHVLETLFTTTAIMFLIFALKHGRRSGYTFADWRNWRALKGTLLYSALAGFFLGIYFLTWAGALVFVFIFLAALILQFFIDHWQRRDTSYLTLVSGILFVIPLITTVAVSSRFYLVVLLIAFLAPLAVGVLAKVLAARPKIIFPAAVVLLAGISIGIFYAVDSSLFGLIFDQFSVFSQSSATKTTTIEAQPFFAPVQGSDLFANSPAWINLVSGVWLNLAGALFLVGFLIFGIYKRRLAADKLPFFVLFLVWTVVIFLMTVAQRRFAYYYTINSALLTAYMSVAVYLALRWCLTLLGTKDIFPVAAHLKRLSGTAVPEAEFTALPPASKRRGKDRGAAQGTPAFIRWGSILISLGGVFLMTFFPLIHVVNSPVSPDANGDRVIRNPIGDMTKTPPYTPPDSWIESLNWLRENTPEPFGDPAAYQQPFALSSGEAVFDYPDTAYGVLSWWDYGFWITRIGHRIPFVNPSQDPAAITTTAQLLLNPDPAAAESKLREIGTPYVIIDQEMAAAKAWAIIEWAGEDLTDYIDAYYVPESGDQVRSSWFFKPAYYQTMMVRLYNFGGEAVPATRTLMIKWEMGKADVGGQTTEIRVVSGTQEFSSYEEALQYIAEHPNENLVIVSDNHLQSPLPLTALDSFQRIYQSPSGGNAVSIFQLVD